MSDGLVKLYRLPELQPRLMRLQSAGYQVRQAMAYEKAQVCQWVRNQFSDGWCSECEIAFARSPLTCFLATHHQQLIGFACYEVTLKNFFGPIGVSRHYQQRGVGEALLLSALIAMRALGYGYAIVGGIDDTTAEFYRKTVGLELIPESSESVYTNRVKAD